MGKKILFFIISILVILLAVVNIFLYMRVTNPAQQVQKQLDLGQQYLLDLEYDEAVAAFEIVIELEPKNVTAYMGMAEAYIGMGEQDKAIKTLKRGYRETEDEELGSWLEELEAAQNREEANVRIVQIDTGEFPNIAVYFSLEDAEGNVIEDVTPDQIQILERDTDEWIEQTGSLQFTKTDVSQRSVAMVVDVSGSMSGSIDQLCGAAQGLISQMQNGNYNVSLTAFDDTWTTLVNYTGNLSSVSNALDNLNTGGGTALYDTLEESLHQAIGQQGQKYILAFTDGEDNNSKITKSELIALANYYHVPIYIIAAMGYGTATQDMEEIAQESGGNFYAISSIDDLYDIYYEIFQMQENLYTFRYITKQSDTECGLRVVYTSNHLDGKAENNFISQKPIRRERVSNQMITGVHATSQREGNSIENAFDASENTMWVEDVWGNGIGESIDIVLDQGHKVNGLTIYNGNRISHDLYEKCSRVKTIKVTFSDGSQRQYEVADDFYGPSQVNFINPIQTSILKIEIVDVYEGTTYQNTCIADISIN